MHSAFEYLSRECTGLNYKIQNVTWAGHLECPNISSREYLKRSVPPLPKELDGAEGTGISFCLPPLDERLSFNVKLEPSLSLADGIYARLDFSWSGTLSPEQLGSRTSSEIERALNALALEPGRVFTS